jgi:hypothetical protein
MMRQVEPFLAIKPSTMVKRHDQLQFDKDFWMQDKTFTIELKGHGKHIEAHGPMKVWKYGERTDQMLLLLKRIGKYLPDMNVTFTGHDVPWVRLLLISVSICPILIFLFRRSSFPARIELGTPSTPSPASVRPILTPSVLFPSSAVSLHSTSPISLLFLLRPHPFER